MQDDFNRLFDDFNKNYKVFCNTLPHTQIDDLFLAKLSYPRIIKNGDKYEVIAEDTNIDEILRDLELSYEEKYTELLWQSIKEKL